MVSDWWSTTSHKRNDPSMSSGRFDASFPHGEAVAWSPWAFPNLAKLTLRDVGAAGIGHWYELISSSRMRSIGRSLFRAGNHEAVLVREDNSLDPVPEAQFGQHMGHVRLDGGLGDEQRLSDLAVGQAAADQ